MAGRTFVVVKEVFYHSNRDNLDREYDQHENNSSSCKFDCIDTIFFCENKFNH